MTDAVVILRQGAVRTLTETLQAPPEETYHVSGTPTWTLYAGAEGAPETLVAGPTPVVGYEAGAARAVSVWAQLDTTALAPGPYRVQWRIDYTSGATGLTDTEQGETALAVVLPGGLRAPYVATMTRLLWDLVPAEDVDRLSELHYYDALRQAVREYGRAWPRLLSTDVPLTAGQYEYPLATLAVGSDPAAAWVPYRSRLKAVWAPFSAAAQGAAPLTPTGYDWDDPRAVWWLREYLPQAGDTARVEWETGHSLTDTVDTTGGVREPLCEWAAGWLLANTLANTAAQTNDAMLEMQIVSYRDMQQRRRQQGMDMMARAVASWTAFPGAPGAAMTIGTVHNPYAAIMPTAFALGTGGGRGR